MNHLKKLHLLVFSLLLFFGCVTIPRPTLTEFSDFRNFVLVEPLKYRIGNTNYVITVPAGFVTDLASIPQPLWSFISPMGKYSKAAIIHDYIYWTHTCSQEQADKIFLIAMKESGVSKYKQQLLYLAVKNFGRGPWKENAREKEKGYIKIIPSQWLNFPEDVTWKEYREQLYNKKVKEKIPEDDTSYCKCGDSTEVPNTQ